MIVRSGDKVVVHGLTGNQGSFWAERMRDYGTNVVAGVSPKKAGTEHAGLPVTATAVDAAALTGIDVSVLFVPAQAVKSSVDDAVNAGAKLIVILTEFVPVHDTMRYVARANEAGTQIIGPNTAGGVTPGEAFVGFMPAFDGRIFQPGNIGVVSRSGSLGTLACLELTRAGLGQSAFLGVGGDPVSGTSSARALQELVDDPATDGIVLIGEIGGTKEEDAAEIVATTNKPVVSFIAGAAAPEGRKMGHAGAIVAGNTGTHASKRSALTEAGAVVVDVPWSIPATLAEMLA